MGRYATLKKEFNFLAEKYGFKIWAKQKHGGYGANYYIIWTNTNIKIMVSYDEQVEDKMSIRIWDAYYFGFDATEYRSEFAQKDGKPREKIRRAAEWLKKAIEDKIVIV